MPVTTGPAHSCESVSHCRRRHGRLSWRWAALAFKYVKVPRHPLLPERRTFVNGSLIKLWKSRNTSPKNLRRLVPKPAIEMTAAIHPVQQDLAFKVVPPWVAPDTASLLQVSRGEIPFSSSATSKVFLPAGALFARITTATYTPHQTYSSVQVGPEVHVELKSDLLFIDHSCQPSLEFDMARFEVRVVKDRPLCEGDKLSFFYPSTEWKMAQPFDCRCDAPKEVCLKRIEGAEGLDDTVLSRYWLNEHINELLAVRRIEKG